MLKACSLTKYFFPPSCRGRGVAAWGEPCAGPGKPRLCPATATGKRFSRAAGQQPLVQKKDTTNSRHWGGEAGTRPWGSGEAAGAQRGNVVAALEPTDTERVAVGGCLGPARPLPGPCPLPLAPGLATRAQKHTWGSSRWHAAGLPSCRRLSKPQWPSLGSLWQCRWSADAPGSLPTSWLMRGKIKLHCGQPISGYLVATAPLMQGQLFSKHASCLNRHHRAGFEGRPPGKHTTGAGSWERREQTASLPRVGCRGSHERGCGMSSRLRHLPGLPLSTGISRDSEWWPHQMLLLTWDRTRL